MYYCRVREGSYARFWRLKTFFQTQYYVGNHMQNLAYEPSHRVLTFYIFFLPLPSPLGSGGPIVLAQLLHRVHFYAFMRRTRFFTQPRPYGYAVACTVTSKPSRKNVGILCTQLNATGTAVQLYCVYCTVYSCSLYCGQEIHR